MSLKSTKVIAGALIIVGWAALVAAQPRPSGTTRTDLQRHDLNIPGREMLQARVDFAPGSSFPRHKHPGEEIIYVLEGGCRGVRGRWAATRPRRGYGGSVRTS